MNRRHFFARTAPVLGASALSPALLAQSASPAAGKAAAEPADTAAVTKLTGRIKKGLKFSMVKEPDLSLLDQFKMLKEVGFDGTELRTADHGELKSYLEVVDKSGLQVHGVVNAVAVVAVLVLR